MGPADGAGSGDAAGAATAVAAPDAVDVEVVFCPGPGRIERVALRLPAGATLADALAASGMAARVEGETGPKHGQGQGALQVEGGREAAEGLLPGIAGRVRPLTTVLRAGDRIELLRPLRVDPKEARRQRYARHKASLAARRVVPRG
jgi:putative ubiquitin-RnfH superfamily antitoxin RatB of RatAB toxin-antitoxin module